ncbi:acetylserotonin O-methyltransferase [Lentzea alba]|uniref:methyltransferase n=1 Tax=Lentzea alba TaxID=2714351 RepID=UPI0039BF0D76
MPVTVATVLDEEDLARVADAMNIIAGHDTESMVRTVMPHLGRGEGAAIGRYTAFNHVALAVFPRTFDGLVEELARQGVDVTRKTPSVVVRDRLCRRYGIRRRDLSVEILRAAVRDRAGQKCELEMFAVLTPEHLAHIAEAERAHSWENHVGLCVPQADPVLVSGLRSAITTCLCPDGGGYNEYEGSTVLYFRGDHPDPAYRRLELVSRGGRLPGVLEQHLRESDVGVELLRLLTGAWATQAIATAAELRLPDHLTTISDLPGLAAATTADQDSLNRLLRYLAALGVVRTSADGFHLTEVGQLLCADVPGSMRPLALMYGGSFYQAFAGLPEAVRTGVASYEKIFGFSHFEHMARDPQVADTFHQSMAASNAVFAEVARVVDFDGAGTVVDIAGGNGQLLSQVLAGTPSLRGVLFEKPHALTTARTVLRAVADRCRLVSGDFTKSVPDEGDIYVLSRILHDWDDEECQRILETCAATMPAHAELLVIERLLPEREGGASLAIPWDVHMLCNVGGRERTESQYRALLARAGFDLLDTQPLPLDIHLLRAIKFEVPEQGRETHHHVGGGH